ncbi:addiction module protein [Thiococcus pfennigii]|jgi:putative addiction module component (TIGR02574 family)|uniref:addiction module protein n=1 Tax=Thiococcus pfennigii TaxID=1057 RepID=UPI0019069167|nr:addiction module protein [Thiococcus pfennigii]MBK1699420.1 hypothetical protein [Thiococcus pfennigii]MBK1731347.1 hypothetical protein [Thiococcus pfennigii]
MSVSITNLEVQALALAPEERVRLADRLLTSLADDSAVDEAWSVEIERRLAALESGDVTPVSYAEAIARARTAIE